MLFIIPSNIFLAIIIHCFIYLNVIAEDKQREACTVLTNSIGTDTLDSEISLT